MRRNHLKTTVNAALLAALFIICVSFVRLPTAFGFIHFADVFLFLAAYFLPLPAACLTCAVGGALGDIMAGYAVYAPATVAIKILMILLINRGKKPLSERNILALLYGLVINVGGYYIFNSFLYEGALADGFSAALASVPTDAIQSVVSAVLFVIVATAAEKFNFGSEKR